MHYYQHHIGDYYSSTATLTFVQHGAYAVMMSVYFFTEKPLPRDRKTLHRMCRAFTKKERDAIDMVADRFYQTDGDVLRIPAVDDAIAEQKSRRNGATAKTFLYLMRNNRNGMVKIGISDEPRARESTLQSEEPEIELLRYWPGTRTLERELHARFSLKRARGEWFRLDESDMDEITALMEVSHGH